MPKELRQNNPDRVAVKEAPFLLREESLPSHLAPLLDTYTFRRSSIAEIDNSYPLTHSAWPGLPETTSSDLRAREMINAPMLGAYTKDEEMVGYSRLLWGYDNEGKSELAIHMTAIKKGLRDGGIGEALQWQARQVALEFPQPPVDQLTATFDNLQGRNCNLPFKIGMVCGSAGGRFIPDAYSSLTGEQHKGNPTDRFQGRWYINSEWVNARREERIQLPTTEQVRNLTTVVDFTVDKEKDIPIPTTPDTSRNDPYLAMPIPLNWDSLLAADRHDGYPVANAWRQTTREVIEHYHSSGYTTIGQVTDGERGANFQIMAYGFDPFNPPTELIKQ